MNIYVLVKRTFHTEEKIIVKGGSIYDGDAEYIINPYDEYAIEEAILQRDQHGGKVTIVTVGNEDAEKELRTGLAMGADEAVLINDEELENGDVYTAATIIANYLKDKEVDLILAGNTTIDGGSGQVALIVAELLKVNAVTTITKLEIESGQATVTRDVEGDAETVSVPLPLLVSCQQGLNDPRYPSLPGIMKAKKKPLEELELDDVDAEDVEPLVEIKTVFLPQQKEAGRLFEGEPAQQVEALIQALRTESKVI